MRQGLAAGRGGVKPAAGATGGAACASNPDMPRLGLCCTFLDGAVRFRATAARHAGGLAARERRRFLGELALDNARALRTAVAWCAEHGIGAFRITSGLLPLATHPKLGYRIEQLPTGDEVLAAFEHARTLA